MMTVTHYTWNPVEDNITAEFDDQGNEVARYTSEPDLYGNVISQDRDGVASYFHHDGIGNTIAVTNDNGDVSDTRAYTSFGEVTESTGITEFPFQFVGQKGYYLDEDAGVQSIRRRNLQPQVARWLSIDPVWPRDGINGYYYVGNSPTAATDPSGLQAIGGSKKGGLDISFSGCEPDEAKKLLPQ